MVGVYGLHGVLMRTVRKFKEEYDKGLEYFLLELQSPFSYTQPFTSFDFPTVSPSFLLLPEFIFHLSTGWEFDLFHLSCLCTLLVSWDIFQFKL